ncbi:MAG TPA: aminotransferase class V-fold PLP-dependent enzyme [Clostridiales bacterium]|nr:aminotransferase class V-fold PLP-dependent enzyme [Clostridiales bacterium]HQP69620.1 aminotransferase class V-fold PLP-dependent enzyme [Clostridiales bacterium]
MNIGSKLSKTNLVYFDNSATSFPKPPAVVDAVVEYMTQAGGNPGRSGHRLAEEAGEIVFLARKALASFFGIKNPMNVVFGPNATDAVNTALKGILNKGDHVITTHLEHNCVMRPLNRLSGDGIIDISVADGDEIGIVSANEIGSLLKPSTKVVVINHVSNVTGVIQPVREIGKMCRSKGVILIVDGAQSGGIVPVNIADDFIDIFAFTGHKALYGPTGTGGMIISDDFDHKILRTLKEGGTGSISDKIEQPDFLPDKLESGTMNVAGIAGLLKGIEFINSLPEGVNSALSHKLTLQKYFIEKASKKVEGFKSYSQTGSPGITSFRMEGFTASDITQQLSDRFNIMSRQGLHCAPSAHQKIGTYPEGTVRFSFSVFSTIAEIDYAIEALKKIRNRNA